MDADDVAKWDDAVDVERNLLKQNTSMEESQILYKQWADSGTYDKIMGDSDTYIALDRLSDGMKEVFPLPSSVGPILDVGAGTGLTANRLKTLGFQTVDALEPLPDFAKVCEGKNLYRKVIVDFLGGETCAQIPDNTYDAIAISGAFAPGHIPCSAIPEMIRLVKSGGFIVNCMRYEYFETVPEYKDRLEPLFNQLEQKGMWKRRKWQIYQKHYGEKSGLLMIYQVC